MAFRPLLAGLLGACLSSSAAFATVVIPLGNLTPPVNVQLPPEVFNAGVFDLVATFYVFTLANATSSASVTVNPSGPLRGSLTLFAEPLGTLLTPIDTAPLSYNGSAYTASLSNFLIGPGAYYVEIAGDPSGEITVGGSVTILVVPEPSTWALMLVGFAGLAFAGYRGTRRGAPVAG
jgi:hypothetical protein